MVLAGFGRWVATWSGRTDPASLELRHLEDGWSARLLGHVDAEAEAFEAELRATSLPLLAPDARPRQLELPVFQRLDWMRVSHNEQRLLQLRDPEGRAAMQIIVTIERPRRMPVFGRAFTPKLGAGTSVEAEWYAVRALLQLARQAGDVVSVRLQPYRRDPIALRDFEGRARRAGYRLAEPVGVTRTLVVDLSRTPDELLVEMSKKTRAKIKHKARQSVVIREIHDRRYIEACTAAVNASMARTAGGQTRFDFEAAFSLCASQPHTARALGLFLPDQPEALLAYAIAFRHGEMAEYSSAGSLDHAALRSMPFNYWLVWELLCWAHGGGARELDLGGVTDGGPGDTRAGISAFKRHFTELDVELGRELCADVRPGRSLALGLWTEARARRAR